MSTPTKTRASIKQATRDALIAAATEEFAESGLEGASLNAICARAGFTRGAFYVHFRDREEILVAVMDRTLGGFVEALTAASDAGTDLERIVTTIALALSASAAPVLGGPALRLHHVLAACDRSPVVGARYAQVLDKATKGVARAVRAGQKAGTVRADIHASAFAELLVGSALGLISMAELGTPMDVMAVAKLVLKMVREAE